VYGCQAKSLSKKILKLLNLNHGQRLLLEQWSSGTLGDLGACMERALAPLDGTFKKHPIIPLEKVDRLLVQLAAQCRFSDPAIKKQREQEYNNDARLQYILMRLKSYEAKWLVRLLLREYCTLQLHEDFVFRQYHFLLPDLLHFQNDFDAAFKLLRGELSRYPSVPAPEAEKNMRIEAAKQLTAVVGTRVGRPTFYKAWSFKNCLQLAGGRAWAAEVKYDGEYCEIHVDLQKSPNIKIFSKNGKDATNDRRGILDIVRRSLSIGLPTCSIKKNCIILGEMVVYSDREQTILPFSKIRKHISRSGSFLGTAQDSAPHEWEHLMVVFFDVLVVDDEPILRECVQKRRDVLRELVQPIPGRAERSQWALISFKTDDGITDLKQVFARSLAQRQEGLVLKPLHAPYFPLMTETGHCHRGYFIKLKKDYLADMGGERDLGDFAVIGGSYDAQVAAKSDVRPLHWTHFHIGCLTNKLAVERTKAKPMFKVVGSLSLDKCIPKPEVKYLNINGRLREIDLSPDGTTTKHYQVEQSKGYGPNMAVAFWKPFVVEVLGGGFEKLQNETFEMLRHPRVKKIHHDRDWKDAVTLEELERMAEAKWEVLDADKLDGHAKDVALLMEKYVKDMHGSQDSASEVGSTQEYTQCTTPRTSQETPRKPESAQENPDDAVIQETQQDTWSTTSSTQFSLSTQGKGIRASKEVRAILVREDTSERLAATSAPLPPEPNANTVFPTPPESSPAQTTSTTTRKRKSVTAILTPPPLKRKEMRTPSQETPKFTTTSVPPPPKPNALLPTPEESSPALTPSTGSSKCGTAMQTTPRLGTGKTRTPLEDAGTKRNLGSFDYDSQDRVVHIHIKEGWQVQVHKD
jgi:DNA ligase-4